MTALYVLLIIAAISIFIFSRKIHFKIFYCGEMQFSLSFLFFKYSLDLGNKPKAHKKKSASPTDAGEKKPEEKKKRQEKPDIKKLLTLITDTLKKLIKWFGASLYLEKFDVRVCVATGDAARTAVLYGAASQILAEAAHLALNIRHRKCDDKKIRTRCDVDFIGDECDFFADAALAFRLWRVVPLAVIALKAFIRLKRDVMKPEEQKAA